MPLNNISDLRLIAEKLYIVVFLLLCMAGVVFPFSVAATNVALGGALVIGVLSGTWGNGALRMWRCYRGLCIAMLLYWGLLLLGLLWSHDRVWGIHVISRQWEWLLVPIITEIMASGHWRTRFLAALSIGLVVHLGFCLLQMFGYVTVTTDASSAADATGHIGHIGFGAVYGMWAGWLLLWGWRRHGWPRMVAWLIAIWAWTFIFMAQGRSGYVVALALFLAVLWKILFRKGDWRWLAWIGGVVILVSGVLAMGPAKERLQITWQNIQAIEHGDIYDAGPRWSMWKAALKIWQSHAGLGVGTGGFPNAAAKMAKLHPEFNYGGITGQVAAHPHNMYLLALTRWSVWGMGAFLLLIWTWIRTGWKMDWRASEAGALIFLSGTALAIQGLTAPSLEEHFEAILAVLLLGSGLAMAQDT